MNIVFYPRFERGYKRLDPQIRRIAHERIALFEQDPFDRRLRTHELHGTLKGVWSFSVDARLRVLFVFLDKQRTRVALLDTGTHRLYS
jgi:mRNA-degrading endonuclease YafQ of YafQ-DinJ toxin-antitoxin module